MINLKFAVVGKIRSGKTVVAEYICKSLYSCEKMEFSDALRNCVDIMYPEIKGTKDREKLIAVGQHMRKLDKEIWVNIIEHKIKESKADHIVVSSVRQQNEVDMLRKNGFKIIKVEAPEEVRVNRCIAAGDVFDKTSFTDPTETDMDNFSYDYKVINNKGIEELKFNVLKILKEESKN